MKQVLEVLHVTKQYKNQRGIFDINFTLQQGDIFGLIGPNGAGKSTLLKVITGLSKANEGEVKIHSYSVSHQFEQAMGEVGCMIEKATVFEYMNAWQNLEHALRFYPSTEKEWIEEILQMVEIYQVRYEKVRHFSSGMKQRLSLALALVSKPSFIILDEPTTSLDIEGIINFRNIILRLAEELHITFLISSHSMHEMEQICNRIGIISQGKLCKQGYISELLRENQTLENLYLATIRGLKENNQDENLD